MEAAASAFSQHSYGLGPRCPDPRYAAQQGHAPHPPSAPGPPGAPRPEEQQQHHKPFFYIQPSQPYMPMQWPVPVPMHVPYNPYYPGLGYGLPMMPHYQPNPYMDPPAFVVPTTHLHLMDYRRMLNPQYYQTMAYHSRRFRYQQNSPSRETTSSEVQTEPLSAAQKAGPSGPGDAPVPAGLPARKGGDDHRSPGVSVKGLPSPAPSAQKSDPAADQKDAAPAPRKQPSGSFVFQTEEVRIECCSTPVGLQLLHETKEVSHSFTQDSGAVLRGWQDEESRVPGEQAEQALQACPDALAVGETPPATYEPESRADPGVVSSDDHDDDADSRAPACSAVRETSGEKDPSETCPFKVVHLPFDPKYLDELWKMESTVWSMKETPSPSSESLIQNSRPESGDVTEDVAPAVQMTPVAEDEPEDMVTAAAAAAEERLGDQMAPEADACPVMDAVEMAPPAAADSSPLKADGNEHQDTSFESLPAYLPSTSWLADFDNVYYCSTMPPTPTKQSRPPGGRGLDMPARRRRLDLDHKGQLAVRKPKERYKLKGKADRSRSLSDHECCLSRSFNENAFAPRASKRERLCSRCVARGGVCEPAGPVPDGRALKRKAAVFQQWNDALLPTCDACRSRSKKRLARKGSGPEARCPPRGRHSEGESSENGSKWRTTTTFAERHGKPNVLKMPLASKQNQEKPREKNCPCSGEHQSVGWERLRRCPHGNAIRETDENRAAPVYLQDKRRIMDHVYPAHRWQTENSWNAAIAHPDSDASRTPHFNKHKKSQSQGNYRKDTRC